MTNYGCFYTPEKFVNALIGMLNKNIEKINECTIIDTSCGYGSFFIHKQIKANKLIMADIDDKALDIAKKNACANKDIQYFNVNALKNIDRNNYNITQNENLIIIGNPPYNDKTSIAKNEIKASILCDIDDDVNTRDLGISFLLSFNKLQADYVAVLHPFSYMIKKANYDLLKRFFRNYSIVDSIIINSQDFDFTSKSSGFPIVIVLYKRTQEGTAHEEIMKREWQTIDGVSFNLKINSIKNYISKYPSKCQTTKIQQPLFWTMRDINALKRNRTFVQEYSNNAIIVDIEKLDYYCYVDVFKDYIQHIPYYYGNCDVFIDNEKFKESKSDFIAWSIEKHPSLKEYFPNIKKACDKLQVENYFKELLGINYIS